MNCIDINISYIYIIKIVSVTSALSETLCDLTRTECGFEKLRIGIIGAGGFAAQHMEAFADIPEVEVVAFMRQSETNHRNRLD